MYAIIIIKETIRAVQMESKIEQELRDEFEKDSLFRQFDLLKNDL